MLTVNLRALKRQLSECLVMNACRQRQRNRVTVAFFIVRRTFCVLDPDWKQWWRRRKSSSKYCSVLHAWGTLLKIYLGKVVPIALSVRLAKCVTRIVLSTSVWADSLKSSTFVLSVSYPRNLEKILTTVPEHYWCSASERVNTFPSAPILLIHCTYFSPCVPRPEQKYRLIE